MIGDVPQDGLWVAQDLGVREAQDRVTKAAQVCVSPFVV
jgi:hypothetical protein